MSIKAAFQRNSLCPLCRAPLDNDMYEAATIESFPEEDDGCDYYWIYKGRTTGWWRYDPITNQNIEDGYNKYIRSTTIQEDDSEEEKIPDQTIDHTFITIGILGRDYIIDFVGMVQKSSHRGMSRRIQRIQKEQEIDNTILKGIAGLRILHESSDQ